jgi:hypothetical protein
MNHAASDLSEKAGGSLILSGDVVFPKTDLLAKLALLFLGERAIYPRNFSINPGSN